MPKRHLTSTEAFDLRQALHVATLDALMASRRWEPGDLVFQGGTSLHLAHGSPRYSEDLDFLVNSSLNLQSLAKAKESALTAVKTTVTPIRLLHGAASGLQTFVPTAELSEIYVDKVFALGARPYLKARDVFDLHWLAAHGISGVCTAENLRVRLETYPDETATAWLTKAQGRRQDLASSTAIVGQDLKRWLPSTWPLTEAAVQSMIQTAIGSLDEGMRVMREVAATAEASGAQGDGS